MPVLKHLLHNLLLSAACCGFTFTAIHVPGVDNKVADAISRFCWQEFQRLAPEAHSNPCPIPQLFLDSLIPLSWRSAAFSSLSKAWPSQRRSLMLQVREDSMIFASKQVNCNPPALPARLRSGLFVCLSPSLQIPAFFHKSLFIRCPIPSHTCRARFPGSPPQLPLPSKSDERNQTLKGLTRG